MKIKLSELKKVIREEVRKSLRLVKEDVEDSVGALRTPLNAQAETEDIHCNACDAEFSVDVNDEYLTCPDCGETKDFDVVEASESDDLTREDYDEYKEVNGQRHPKDQEDRDDYEEDRGSDFRLEDDEGVLTRR